MLSPVYSSALPQIKFAFKGANGVTFVGSFIRPAPTCREPVVFQALLWLWEVPVCQADKCSLSWGA